MLRGRKKNFVSRRVGKKGRIDGWIEFRETWTRSRIKSCPPKFFTPRLSAFLSWPEISSLVRPSINHVTFNRALFLILSGGISYSRARVDLIYFPSTTRSVHSLSRAVSTLINKLYYYTYICICVYESALSTLRESGARARGLITVELTLIGFLIPVYWNRILPPDNGEGRKNCSLN